ncbi:MAG: glycoside hydrolase family 32 protein, partial [Oscillibacter sp.]|nr:glycoside hydrolase family 32 protein [Oscillibacter sp.]
MSEALQKARDFETANGPLIPKEARPVFHFTPPIGWLNDPNGFSVYRGEYHLFYQYHPFSSMWGPMYWGHAKTTDFLSWEHLGAAMAPDSDYDLDGCWSGSAAELDDGRQLLLYTGRRTREDGKTYQTQCLAAGDGRDYEKYAANPVLTGADLPEGCSPLDFR